MGHLRKRGRYYYAVVYTSKGHVERSLKTEDYQEALKRLQEFKMKVLSDDLGKNEKMKLGEFLDEWLELYAKLNVRRTTFETYEISIRCHIKPELGHIRLSELRPVHLQRYFSKKLAEGLSPTTVRYHHKVLRKALNTAIDWEYITKNVAAKSIPPPLSDFEPRVWTLEESKRFLEVAKSDRNFALYATVLLTGLRRGEVLGLKRSDFNPDEGYLRVVRQLVNTKEGVKEHPPKSKKGKRIVMIGPVLVQILKDHIRRIDEEKKKAKHWEEHGWLFPNRSGRYLDPVNVSRRAFPRLIKKAGVPKIRFHDLRHTHFTDLLEAGVHLKVAGERAGHSSISITGDVYSHVRSPIQKEAAMVSEQRLLGEVVGNSLANSLAND